MGHNPLADNETTYCHQHFVAVVFLIEDSMHQEVQRARV